MAYVKVTFRLEASDPDHDMGVTTEEYERVSEAIISMGGDDPDFELVEEEDDR